MNLIDHNLKKFLEQDEVVMKVQGQEHYYITSKGRLFSSKRKWHHETLKKEVVGTVLWKEIKPFLVRGYKAVSIYNKSTKRNKTYYIHDIVYTNFFGEINREYLRIIHIDKDKLNNEVENLMVDFRKNDDKFKQEYYKKSRLLDMLNTY